MARVYRRNKQGEFSSGGGGGGTTYNLTSGAGSFKTPHLDAKAKSTAHSDAKSLASGAKQAHSDAAAMNKARNGFTEAHAKNFNEAFKAGAAHLAPHAQTLDAAAKNRQLDSSTKATAKNAANTIRSMQNSRGPFATQTMQNLSRQHEQTARDMEEVSGALLKL